MAARTTAPLVGRDAELDELSALLANGGAVLLSGDAGVGKTRLLTEARDRLADQGWRVVAGHCLDLGDSALPYLPFSEVLGRLAADLPEVVAEVAGRHPALARLQPGRRTLAEESAEGAAIDRSALYDAVQALFEAAADAGPLLVVVEDAHWADQSTRHLLTVLFTRPATRQVSLVVSYRADDLHRRHPLRRQVAEWSRLGGVRRMPLDRLGDHAVQQLIAALAPEGLSSVEALDIVDRAEGNAFFVEELTSAAAGPGRWVPTELADVLLVRLDRLDEQGRQVVRVASVAGRQVTHDLLAAASGMASGPLDAGLRQAVEMNVLVPTGDRYAFRHALLGEAVYDDLLPGERVRLHTGFAAALRDGEVAGTAAELARHSRLAHDLETALHASLRAGHDALGVGGPEEAVHHYEQALALLTDPGRPTSSDDVDRSAVVVHLAEALTAAGRPHRAATLLGEELSELPASAPDTWRARMLAARAYLLLITESEEHPADLSAEALRLVSDPTLAESAIRARVLATHARVLTTSGRVEEALPIGVEGLALAERLNLTDTVLDLLVTVGQAQHPGPHAGLREALEEAIRRAHDSGGIQAEVRARFVLARTDEDAGDWDAAEAGFSEAVARGDAAGLPYAPYVFESRWHLLFHHVVHGRWDAALELTSAPGAPPQVPRALLDLFATQIEQARGGDVSGRLPGLRRLWEKEGLIAVHSSALEMIDASRRGDPDAVLAAYDDAVATLSRLWQPWFSARIRLAATAIGALGDLAPNLSAADRAARLARAEELHAEGHVVLERHHSPSGRWGPEGRAWVKRLDAELLRLRWLAGDPPDHETLVETWREVETLTVDFGDVYQVAVVRVVLAAILRAGGDQQAAREVADLARASARELGAQPLLAELTGQGSRPTRRTPEAGTLTARESEILALVAQGLSNGEIGKQLFIATKTVSVHVSNILGKLGAASRTEAAAIGRRRGLVE